VVAAVDRASEAAGEAAVTASYSLTAEESPAKSLPVYILVLRATGLVEGLGGCNPYAVLSWGDLGHARTHSVPYTSSPNFMQNLKFRSPIVLNGPSAELLIALGEDLYVNWQPEGTLVQVYSPPLTVSIYSANSSVSDDLLAQGEVDTYQMLQHPVVHTIALYDQRDKPAGAIELQFMFNKC